TASSHSRRAPRHEAPAIPGTSSFRARWRGSPRSIAWRPTVIPRPDRGKSTLRCARGGDHLAGSFEAARTFELLWLGGHLVRGRFLAGLAGTRGTGFEPVAFGSRGAL